MLGLERDQAVKYLEERLNVVRASEVLAVASRRGLGSLASNPGGLLMLADIDLLNRPPESLTDILVRLEDSVWDKLARDKRIQDAGGETMEAVKRTIRRLAAASQLCQLANIELPQDGRLFSADALSARLISGGRISESVLHILMGSHGFIDSGTAHHQVKIFPDELPPYMAARYLSDLVQSPDTAHQLIASLSWEASSGEQGVDKRLLPMMGWLATLNPHCRAEIVRIDPQALAFFGDLRNPNVPTPDAERALRESIASLVDRNEWPGRGQYRLTSENYWQAGPARLAAVLADLFREYGNNLRARDVLLDIAGFAGSDVLRQPVMAANGSDYAKLLNNSMDVYYILELGREDDLKGLAAALLASPDTPESLTARLTEKLGWHYLRPQNVVSILQRHLARGHRGYQLTLDVKQELVPSASNQQLFELARGLALRASATLDKPGRRTPQMRMANERFLEFASEVVAALLRRNNAASPDKLAILCLLLFRVVQRGHYGTADVEELKEALKLRTDVRRAYFKHLVRWVPDKKDELWFVLFCYGTFCVPTEDDVRALGLERLTKAVQEENERAADAASQQRPTPERKERIQLSAEAKKELAAVAQGVREATALNALAWLASWLLQTNTNSRYGEVDFSQFEKRAGKELTAAVREGFARLWRTQAPSFREDQPNSTYHITAAGLQGLYLELGDGKDLPKMRPEEVRQAIRYARFEINGYPDWFWAVVGAHQEVAGEELESIAKAAGEGEVSRGHAENLFSALDEAPQSIRERLAPLAWHALKAQSTETRKYVVDRMLRATKALPDVTSQAEFEQLAWQRISQPFTERESVEGEQPHADQNAMGQATVWGSHWLTRHPRSFVERMQQWMTDDLNGAKAFLYALAAELGQEHAALLRSVATDTDDGVDSLGALYVLTLDVVNPKQDKECSPGEVYSMGRRDNAQELCESLVPAITDAGTERAYLVLEWLKQKLNGDRAPYFRHFQYRLRETTLGPLTIQQRDFDRFEAELRVPVTDSQSFNLAVQSALLAVKYDIERGEHSLRRFFSAINFNALRTDRDGLALESDFQQLLASELKHHARNQFMVQREPETAEHNRRDVHCSKESLQLTASIELKMSERWTLADYIEALDEQLVGQYMRHRNARTGFLVIVLQRARSWQDPNTGAWLSFDQLIRRLQQRANTLMRDDSGLFLRVIGIDAVPPQNFRQARSTTRKRASRPKSTKASPAGTTSAKRLTHLKLRPRQSEKGSRQRNS